MSLDSSKMICYQVERANYLLRPIYRFRGARVSRGELVWDSVGWRVAGK